jgi:hypothetical protein
LTPVSRIKEIESIQFKEKTMRIITVVALFAVMLAGTAFAGDSGNGCKLQGTWVWEFPFPLPWDENFALKYLITYMGTGDNEGTDITEPLNSDFFYGPDLSLSSSHGIWVKSGPGQYDYTVVAYVADRASGIIVAGSMTSGTKILTGCNTAEATAVTIPLIPGTMEPVPGAEPTFVGSGVGHRLLLQKPIQ